MRVCQRTQITLFLMSAFIVAYGYIVVAVPTISPEIGLAYLSFVKVETFGQAFAKFFSFHETWYRPFTFYVIGHTIFSLIDIHSIHLLKLVSFLGIALTGILAALLARTVFRSSRVELAIVFCLTVSHPLYKYIAFEGSGITDPVFITFINLFLICLVSLLRSDSAWLGAPVFIGKYRKYGLVAICAGCMIGAISSQERAVAIFPMTCLLYLFFCFRTRRAVPPAHAIERASHAFPLAILSTTILIAAAYYFFVYLNKGVWTGETYRTGFEISHVIKNSVSAALYPLRIMSVRTGASYDYFEDAFAISLVLITLIYAFKIWATHDVTEGNRIGVVLILYVSSLPIAVLFGGAPWHFYSAGVYASILTARAIAKMLEQRSSNVALVCTGLLFASLFATTFRGVTWRFQPGQSTLPPFLYLVPRALADNVLKHPPYHPEVVYYDTGAYGDFNWPFGGQGNLFKYLYHDPKIVEIHLVRGEITAAGRRLCPAAVGKRALGFQFNADDLSWSTIDPTVCTP